MQFKNIEVFSILNVFFIIVISMLWWWSMKYCGILQTVNHFTFGENN